MSIPTLRIALVAVALALVVSPSEGALRVPQKPGLYPAPASAPSLAPMSDQTYPVRVTWAGVGQLRAFTITNVALLGLYEPAIGWEGYDGTWPADVTNWNAYCCEWPAGSRQFYNFSSGIWVGGVKPKIVAGDTVRVPIVATGSYHPDLTPVSPLWASNQWGAPNTPGEGQFLFVQPGEEGSPNQIQWGNPADFSGYLYFPQTEAASINARRRVAFGDTIYDVKPTDFVSQMDTYCMLGDYVPEDQGYFVYPSYGYDVEPLGVRMEQRTYSWSYGPSANYIFVSYNITNMNDFAIDSVYVGFFMDNDVGPGDLEAVGVGPNDDLVGFDRSLNLGYTFDSNFSEPGWATSAGYIGIVLVETPRNPGDPAPLGLTAFSTWTREGVEQDVDLTDQDALKYAQLRGWGIPGDPDERIFETFEEPQDVRHLSASGPYLHMEPGETISLTMAIVMGQSLDDLKENTRRAIQQFEMGYLGTAPPPAPRLTVTPGDRRVFLSWDNSPESTQDLITGEEDFEGYRIYRSRTGVEGAWQLLADYDVAGSLTEKSVAVSYARGGGDLNFGFAGFWGTGRDSVAFVGNDYALEFQSDSTFTVFNTDQQSLYRYNPEARDIFTGDFCVVDADNDAIVYPAPEPGNPFLGQWVDGARIYIDGFYVFIQSGQFDPADPVGTIYTPAAGDLFTIATFGWQEVGNQTGLYYSYTDEDLTNGLTYWYAVTSYDRGSPVQGIDPLESSIAQSKERVVPHSRPVDRMDPDAQWTRLSPSLGNGELYVGVAQPAEVTGHAYRLELTGEEGAQSWQAQLRDVDAGRVVSTLIRVLAWDFTDTSQTRQIRLPDDAADASLADGLLIVLKAPSRIRVDEVSWTDGSTTTWVPTALNWNQYIDRLEPYSYRMTFPEGGGLDVAGNPVPWHMENVTLGVPARTHLFHGAGGDPDTWDSSDYVFILKQSAESFSATQAVIRFSMNMEDSTHAAGVGDTLNITTMRPFYAGDAFEIQTVSSQTPRQDYDLSQVRVVPNPYYLRAAWDTNQYNRWINFEHLPSRCTIRIFTAAGLLVRELQHQATADDWSARWDLLTSEQMHCTSGLYVYQVEDRSTGKTAVGKFAIVR
ncbi:hypothetical protein JXA88_12515 [Candidatus Fermentibacteria bacterium]|nr:hypothetical protein [Candidatus Fermentibacteria bacterium]